MKNITINKKWCKKCGICMEFCPKKVFEPDEDGRPQPKNMDQCINCGLCSKRCPDFAITLEVE